MKEERENAIVSNKTTRKAERIAGCGTSNHGYCIASMFYHRAHLTEYPDGLYNRRGITGGGNDIFFIGSRAGYDAYGRTGRQLHDKNEAALDYDRAGICFRVYYYCL